MKTGNRRTRWIAVVIRHPWRVVAAAAVLGVVAAIVGGPVESELSPGGFTDPNSQSQLALRQIADATHANPDRTIVAWVHPGVPVSSAAGAAELTRVRDVLRADPAIATVSDASTDAALSSRDGSSAYTVAQIKPMSDKNEKSVALRVEDAFASDTHITLGGSVIANQQVQEQVSKDLTKAELLAAVILVPLLILVFRGVIASFLPPLVGILTILTTFLFLRLINMTTDLSVFALSLVTGLGLGLSIDYSLIMVSRYREEAARHGYGAQAVRRTLATAGRTVLFSSLTVSAAVASLMVFPQQFLYSMGIGGVLVTLTAAAVALTVLPAVLLLLGSRLDALSLRRRTDSTSRNGAWYRLARTVMRRPGTIAAATGGVLLVLGLPFLGIKFTSIDASVLPQGASARQVDQAIHRDLAADVTTPITVTVAAPASAKTDVSGLAARMQRLPSVALVQPPRYVGADTWIINVASASSVLSDASRDLVLALRSVPSDAPVRVAGETAQFVDLRASLNSHLPLAIAIVALATIAVLFALTGSAVLPLAAVVMNALSLSAAFGLLVFIFQGGRLTGLLGYTSQGALESTQPVLLFAMAFGLSTDYGVFLLARIKEAHDRGLSTGEAVSTGLEHTGKLVTAAAALFCVAMGAFATSSIVFIKELGVGTALAVLVDATMVRALLVPSLMALIGRRNWWAPRPLRALHHRLHLDGLEEQLEPALEAA